MNYLITSIGRRRKRRSAPPNTNFLTLAQYHETARRVIGKYAPYHIKSSMLGSEDAIDFVAFHIMYSDWWYEDDGSKIETIRLSSGRYAILEYITLINKQKKMQSLEVSVTENETSIAETCVDEREIDPFIRTQTDESSVETSDYITGLINALTYVQQQCVSMYYLEGLKHTEIARRMSMTREGVRKSIIEGLKRLQELASETPYER